MFIEVMRITRTLLKLFFDCKMLVRVKTFGLSRNEVAPTRKVIKRVFKFRRNGKHTIPHTLRILYVRSPSNGHL